MSAPEHVDARPLIVTLELEPAAHAWFDDLRRRHFPPERNVLSAHLTLFHHLPGDRLETVRRTLAAGASATATFEMEQTGPMSLGRGVAYRFRSPELAALRGRLVAAFDPWLTPQDRSAHRPHVTVQNKVDPADARALLAELQADFEPFPVRAEALLLHRYVGGPWEPLGRFPFAQSA